MTRLEKNLDDVKAQAVALEEKGNWKRAASAWRRAAKTAPHDLAMWLRAAMCQRRLSLPREARQTLHAALKENGVPNASREAVEIGAPCDAPIAMPLLRDTWLALAETFLETQDWGKSRHVCQYILRALPRDHGAREVLSTALLQDGKVLEATAVMRELLALSPLDPLHRFKLATLLQIQGNHAQAHREYSRVLAQTRGGGYGEMESDAADIIEMLDNVQIREILTRAGDDFEFAQELLSNFDDALQDGDFHLSENGLGSLRQMISDGRPEAAPRVPTLLQ